MVVIVPMVVVAMRIVMVVVVAVVMPMAMARQALPRSKAEGAPVSVSTRKLTMAAAPPPMPPAQATSSADEPEVRIIEQKNATITEYRSNGRLYKIKVQPKIGPAYYLIDKEGKGRFDRGDNPALENMPVPQWVLFEF